MKHILCSFLCLITFKALAASSAHPQSKVCGRFEVLNSVGLLPVRQPVLYVPADDLEQVDSTYVLRNAGDNVAQAETRQSLIASMAEGRNYCVTGSVTTLSVDTRQLTPDRVEDAP